MSTAPQTSVPAFGQDGHLPCGRYRLGMDQVWDLLVDAPEFKGSSTRPRLWDGLTEYVLTFERVQDRFAQLLDGCAIIHHLWLGGSFVSGKLNPRDMDLTVFTDARALEAIKGRAGSGWIKDAFRRDQVRRQYRLEPHQVRYVAVPHVFRPQEFTAEAIEYFRDRGRYDDWWQRCRVPGAADEDEPTVESAVPARGYLEVTL